MRATSRPDVQPGLRPSRATCLDHGLLAFPRTVWLVGLISLLNDSAGEMIYPLVPFYLASVLIQQAGAFSAFAFSATCALAAAGLLPLWALRASRAA